MIATIAHAELRSFVRDHRSRWIAAIVGVLLIAALLAGWQRNADQLAERAIAQHASNDQWLHQGDKNPHSAAHYGNYAFKPAGPLSFFDPGVEAFAGTQVFMEAHKQNLAVSPRARDASEIARFGELSGALILQGLVPLVIVLLAYTAFAAERERGTLRQLLALGVSPRSLLWGKSAGIASALLLVLAPALVVGGAFALAAAPTSDDTFIADLALRTLLLVAAYLLYWAAYLFLSLAVSARARSGRAALGILVAFWAFTSFLAPKMAAEISSDVAPAPSLGEFQAALRTDQQRGLDGVTPWQKIDAYKQRLFAKYRVDKVSDLPVYWPAARMQFLEELDQPVFDKHYGALSAVYLRQRRIQDMLGIVAPLLPLRSLSMGLAGTDLIHHAAFTAQAESYRRNMIDQMNGYLSQAAVSLNGSYSSSRFMVADESVFARVKPFRYAPPPLAATLREHAGGLALLLAWSVAALLAAVASVRALKVEG